MATLQPERRFQLTITGLLLAVAGVSVLIWVVTEQVAFELTRKRMGQYEIRMKAWQWIADQQPPGSDDRSKCLELAKWYKARVNLINARRSDPPGIAEEELRLRQREAALGNRLGVTGIKW